MEVVNRYAEKKFFDTYNNLGTLSWSADGVIFDVSIPAQGTTDTNRVGDKLMANSFEIRLMFYGLPNSPDIFAQFYRMILFKYMDDSTPNTGSILQNMGTPTAIVSPFDHDRKLKRKILLDETICILNYRSYYIMDNACVSKKYFIDLKKRSTKLRQVAFEGGSVNGIGKFYIMLVSNIPLADMATDSQGWQMYTRMNFTDV